MTNRPGISKYFIALVPPSPVYELALQWKNFFKEKYNSKAALRSPPHITLHMPFEWRASKEEALIESLNGFSKTCSSFEVSLDDFGCFEPRVIFIKVARNETLAELQARLTQFCKSELNLFNANRKDQPYLPHVTVAFRDLKKSVFQEAWHEVEQQKFDELFRCRHLTVLKHNGNQWSILKQFEFPH